ncbi:AraC family transcriptional regulator [Vitiosangium sp. GDMCC 1.1324]|uniref:AraC family transcriptional regulator n=1 Tax=Vitiosangium sp. (strain GDMCC 1.1324) TaxID=2138576 RepID=UPI00130E3A7F|nr:AraC family transcriptional regulator [Vitiosangium sp. GDMCC 1.1324]
MSVDPLATVRRMARSGSTPAAPASRARTPRPALAHAAPPPGVLSPREECTLWLVEELGGLEMLKATYITHTFAPHTHDGFAIGVIERGVESFRCRGQMQHAAAGSVVVVNPGDVHTGQSGEEEGFSYRMLYPDAKLLADVATELSGRIQGVPDFRSPVIEDPEIATRIRALHAALERPSSALERQSLLLATLAPLVSRHSEARVAPRVERPEHAAVRRALDYLEAHPGENVTLEELARVAGLSVFHLVRVFRRERGLTPHAWQLQVRIRRARELLVRGMPPGQVAAELGFTDQSHLTREFKRRIGVTPGRYAASAIASKTRTAPGPTLGA